jgi:hypothetical protein
VHVEIPPLLNDDVLLLTEHRHHAAIVYGLLKASGLPEDRVKIVAAEGREGLKRLIGLIASPDLRAYALAAAPALHVPSAVERLKKELTPNEHIGMICAIQGVESWLLSDDELLKRLAGDDPELLQMIAELPPPDEIVDPFSVAHRLLGASPPSTVAASIDVYRAAARNPSLRHFLSTMAAALNVPADLPAESAARTLNREVIAGIVREMMPEDAVAWRTSDGHVYTAQEISHEIENGTETGHQYARDVLRVAVDFVRRQGKQRKRS